MELRLDSMRFYISTEEAPFFINNKMEHANSIPVEGVYKVGDFVISSTQENGIFGWVCTVAGNPGEWEVIGSGAAAGGDNKVVGYVNAVSFSDARSSVEIGINEYEKGKDFLEVHYNGLLLAEGVHYNVSADGKSITAIDDVWNENADDTQQMIFKVLKSNVSVIEPTDGSVTIDKLSDDIKEDLAAIDGLIASVDIQNTTISNINDRVDVIESGGGMSGKQDKTDNNLATTDKTIVGAINELFQSANNGKQLIASAIGEPLNAEDTFSAMSDDINSLLSTFKTNMMNNGITVESNDKFKALIDKIATLADSEGKSVQMTNGTFSFHHPVENSYGDLETTTVETGLDFTPTLILVNCTITTDSYPYTVLNKGYISNLETFTYKTNTLDRPSLQIYIDNITKESFNLNVSTTVYTGVTCTNWYAIGVGEENTALRDSLASILEEEGVSITEEDDMASLISKVDEEFENKNANSGLDIISATELPATGRENQICIITDNPTDTILLTSSVADTQSEGINIYLGNSSSSDVSMGTLVPISTNGITMNYYFNRVYQGSNRLASYHYINNTWAPLTNKYIPIFEDGAITTTELNTGLNMDGASVTNGELILDASADGEYYLIYSKNKINFSDISKIEVVLKKNYVSGNYNPRIYVGASDNPSTYSNIVVAQAQKDVSSTSYTTWVIDTSSWTGTHYFIIQKYNEYSGLRCYIQSIRIY